MDDTAYHTISNYQDTSKYMDLDAGVFDGPYCESYQKSFMSLKLSRPSATCELASNLKQS